MSPPPPAPGARGGCLRVVLGAWLLVLATAAGVVFLLGDHSVDAPQLVTVRPTVAGPVPSVGPAPVALTLTPSQQARVAASVVLVSGTACQEIQQGSGFVVRPGYVLTDAHVVAGERSTVVIDHRGSQIRATVVRFDPVRDLALLHLAGVASTHLPVLALATPSAPADLAVFGHPGGGTLRIAPAHLAPTGFVDNNGADIYGRVAKRTRRVLALAAHLAPGDSGAPVVDRRERVVGVAFAIDTAGRPVAYALSASEVTAATQPAIFAVPTGRCVSL